MNRTDVCTFTLATLLMLLPFLINPHYLVGEEEDCDIAPKCNEQHPEAFPPACGGTYTRCEDMTQQACPAGASCNDKTGKYPEYPPTTCEACTEKERAVNGPCNCHDCTNNPVEDTECFRIKICTWQPTAQQCQSNGLCSTERTSYMVQFPCPPSGH